MLIINENHLIKYLKEFIKTVLLFLNKLFYLLIVCAVYLCCLISNMLTSNRIEVLQISHLWGLVVI